MRRVIGILAILLLPLQALAADKYDENATTPWSIITRVQKNIVYKSKYATSEKEAKRVKKVYALTKARFKRFTGVDVDTCNPGYLEIRVVSLEDLSNKNYFPREATYTTSHSLIIGRYFRRSNKLYLVHRKHHYNWHKNLAHELVHHFLDECGIRFESDHVEHEVIDQFEQRYYGDSA